MHSVLMWLGEKIERKLDLAFTGFGNWQPHLQVNQQIVILKNYALARFFIPIS